MSSESHNTFIYTHYTEYLTFVKRTRYMLDSLSAYLTLPSLYLNESINHFALNRNHIHDNTVCYLFHSGSAVQLFVPTDPICTHIPNHNDSLTESSDAPSSSPHSVDSIRIQFPTRQNPVLSSIHPSSSKISCKSLNRAIPQTFCESTNFAFNFTYANAEFFDKDPINSTVEECPLSELFEPENSLDLFPDHKGLIKSTCFLNESWWYVEGSLGNGAVKWFQRKLLSL